MTLYLTHTTALQYWRSEHASNAKRSRAALPFGNNAATCTQPSFAEIESLYTSAYRTLTQPFHLLISHASLRTRHPNAVFHVCTQTLPSGSFMHVAPGILVASPALCYLQHASMLPFPLYLQLGFELCGHYRMQQDLQGEPLEAEPVSSVRSLLQYIQKAANLRGAATAAQATHYLCDNSKSPMETDITIIYCLPVRMGGHGLPRPILNHKVKVASKKQAILPQSYFEVDLLWPSAHIGVEYDSAKYHHGSVKLLHDEVRKNGIRFFGIQIVTLRTEQAKIATEFNRTALLIAKALGKRIRPKPSYWQHKNAELRQLLFARFQSTINR